MLRVLPVFAARWSPRIGSHAGKNPWARKGGVLGWIELNFLSMPVWGGGVVGFNHNLFRESFHDLKPGLPSESTHFFIKLFLKWFTGLLFIASEDHRNPHCPRNTALSVF
jgi:hypothetical protein